MIFEKETALFQKDKIATDINEAGGKASKYISSDSTGIMVYDGESGVQTPSAVQTNTNNVFIDDDSVDVRKGTRVLSSFGANKAIIGNETSSHVTIENNKFTLTSGLAQYHTDFDWSAGNLYIRNYVNDSVLSAVYIRTVGVEAENIHQVITARPSSVISLSNSFKKVALDDTSPYVGSFLRIDNGGVKCLREGSVMVSGQVQFLNTNTNDLLDVVIYLDNTTNSVCESASRMGSTSTTRLTLTMAPHLIDVEENDILYLYVANRSGSRGTACGLSGEDADVDKSYMSVWYV